MKLENLIKEKLKQLHENHDVEKENYMFFGNLQQMNRQTKLLMNWALLSGM